MPADPMRSNFSIVAAPNRFACPSRTAAVRGLGRCSCGPRDGTVRGDGVCPAAGSQCRPAGFAAEPRARGYCPCSVRRETAGGAREHGRTWRQASSAGGARPRETGCDATAPAVPATAGARDDRRLRAAAAGFDPGWPRRARWSGLKICAPFATVDRAYCRDARIREPERLRADVPPPYRTTPRAFRSGERT
jgi:hypothetical protein